MTAVPALKVHFSAGSSRLECVEGACALARRMSLPICFDFNEAENFVVLTTETVDEADQRLLRLLVALKVGR